VLEPPRCKIGKWLGIEMYGTSSSDDKLARVKALGLQHGINYKQLELRRSDQDLTRSEGVDAVFEMWGGEHTTRVCGACVISVA